VILASAMGRARRSSPAHSSPPSLVLLDIDNPVEAEEPDHQTEVHLQLAPEGPASWRKRLESSGPGHQAGGHHATFTPVWPRSPVRHAAAGDLECPHPGQNQGVAGGVLAIHGTVPMARDLDRSVPGRSPKTTWAISHLGHADGARRTRIRVLSQRQGRAQIWSPARRRTRRSIRLTSRMVSAARDRQPSLLSQAMRHGDEAAQRAAPRYLQSPR
jgi:hypothetical protein